MPPLTAFLVNQSYDENADLAFALSPYKAVRNNFILHHLQTPITTSSQFLLWLWSSQTLKVLPLLEHHMTV